MMYRLLMVLGLLALAGCGAPKEDLATRPLVDLGNFRMGHNIVVGETARQMPPSRGATAEEWKTALTAAMDDRFSRYDGEKLYHFGVSVDAYTLAIPGIPIVLSPKSALVVSVTVWDNATQTKLNEEVEQIVIFESLSTKTVTGSGLTQSKEDQIENLVKNAAFSIEKWMVQNNAWFQ
ncbi:hypothetical protein [Algirhabdus cladophorae]|uniref:hypothetical protein n=1 Tax=Algirhabdus cladophorae TaxID=3377108 RepID=UPI003B8468B4